MSQGRWADALDALRRDSTFSVTLQANRAICEARLGRLADARKRAVALEARRAQRYVAADRIAKVYAAVGDVPTAMRWLETALAERAAAMVDLTPFAWDPIRADPRFRAFELRVDAARLRTDE